MVDNSSRFVNVGQHLGTEKPSLQYEMTEKKKDQLKIEVKPEWKASKSYRYLCFSVQYEITEVTQAVTKL